MMKPRLHFPALLIILLLSGVEAAEQEYPPVNPALLYWQAAAILPALTEEQATNLRDMAAGKLPVDPSKVTAPGSDGTIRLLRKAAASSAACDWGIPREDGPTTAMPHLSKMRQMSSLVLVESERQFLEGDPASGIELLLIAHRMARHAGAGDTLISFLVQESGEENALRAAARHCLSWDDATRRHYAEQLNSLPSPSSLQGSYRGERVFIDWLVNLSRLDGEAKRKMLIETIGSVSGDNDPSEEKLLRALDDPASLDEEISAYRSLHNRTLAALGKPWKEGSLELETINAEIRDSDLILAKLVFPATTSVHNRAFVTKTLRIMLSAALDHGAELDESTAAIYLDAFAGKPLRLLKGEGRTFILVTAEPSHQDKVIQLSLGR